MGELLNVLQSLCLPCALIPILKLTSSKEVMGHAFRSYNLWKYITWSLAFTIIFFNLFLFIIYLEELPNIYVGYIGGIIYFAFVLYLAILPLDGKQEGLEIDEIDGYKVMTNHSG
jgi:hypothetical protein